MSDCKEDCMDIALQDDDLKNIWNVEDFAHFNDPDRCLLLKDKMKKKVMKAISSSQSDVDELFQMQSYEYTQSIDSFPRLDEGPICRPLDVPFNSKSLEDDPDSVWNDPDRCPSLQELDRATLQSVLEEGKCVHCKDLPSNYEAFHVPCSVNLPQAINNEEQEFPLDLRTRVRNEDDDFSDYVQFVSLPRKENGKRNEIQNED